MEALVRRAGLSRLRRCRTASGYGLDRNTRHGRIYCALLALVLKKGVSARFLV